MEGRQIIVQKINKTETSNFDIAKKYYSVLLALNGITISELEMNLLCYIASYGTISAGGRKEEFCTMFQTTIPSIRNTAHKLTKRGFLIKINNKIKVIDGLQLDFNKDIVLNAKIEHAS